MLVWFIFESIVNNLKKFTHLEIVSVHIGHCSKDPVLTYFTEVKRNILNTFLNELFVYQNSTECFAICFKSYYMGVIPQAV